MGGETKKKKKRETLVPVLPSKVERLTKRMRDLLEEKVAEISSALYKFLESM